MTQTWSRPDTADPIAAFFGYFLCSSKESDCRPAQGRANRPIRNQVSQKPRRIRRFNKPQPQAPAARLRQKKSPSNEKTEPPKKAHAEKTSAWPPPPAPSPRCHFRRPFERKE